MAIGVTDQILEKFLRAIAEREQLTGPAAAVDWLVHRPYGWRHCHTNFVGRDGVQCRRTHACPSRRPSTNAIGPGEVISHAVWLYYRFLLSYRDVEELLAERGIAVSYETIRRWCHKFGQTFADGLRRQRPRPGDQWHIDEVQLKIHGRKHWLWRAVDQEGVVLDILVQSRRNQEAAETFLRRLVEGCGYAPRVVLTDKLASYPGAVRRVLPGAEHRRHKGLNNRAENSLCGPKTRSAKSTSGMRVGWDCHIYPLRSAAGEPERGCTYQSISTRRRAPWTHATRPSGSAGGLSR